MWTGYGNQRFDGGQITKFHYLVSALLCAARQLAGHLAMGIWLNAKAFSLAEMQRHSAVSKTMAKRWKRFA
jgi:hypothetical protein